MASETPDAIANPYAAPVAPVEDVAVGAATSAPLFFPVGLAKLAVMTVVTFGFYEIYWFYKNWKCVQRNGERVNAPIRAFFYPIIAYSLFRRIRERGQGTPGFSLRATPLAWAVFIFTALSRLPDPFWLLSFLSVVPLLMVQSAVNVLNASVVPDADRNTRFTIWNIVWCVAGGSLLTLGLIGMLLPTK